MSYHNYIYSQSYIFELNLNTNELKIYHSFYYYNIQTLKYNNTVTHISTFRNNHVFL